MLQCFLRNKSGAVTVETSFVLMIMVAVTGGLVEAGYAYWQWNGVQQAARHGARLAATTDAVSRDITTMTGIGNGVSVGDPMPDFIRECSGRTQRCSRGRYNRRAMDAIFFGPDRDLKCAPTERLRRGMCDIFQDIEKRNITVSYENSGLGHAGFPANPKPLVTVKVTDLKFNFIFLDLFLPDSLTTMPDVSVSLMSEDLRSGV